MVKDELELGMLVQVDANDRFGLVADTMMSKHGHLWIIKSRVLPDGYVWCRSIATGYDFDWHHHDLNLPNQEEEEEAEMRAEEACARLGITDEKTRRFLVEHERKHIEIAQRKEDEC